MREKAQIKPEKKKKISVWFKDLAAGGWEKQSGDTQINDFLTDGELAHKGCWPAVLHPDWRQRKAEMGVNRRRGPVS